MHYTDGYPDKLPDLSLEAIEGELEDDELESLLHELRTIVRIVYLAAIPSLIQRFQGEENLGMAMTFTLVSHLREKLSHLVRLRAENIAKAEAEKERLAIEVSHIDI